MNTLVHEGDTLRYVFQHCKRQKSLYVLESYLEVRKASCSHKSPHLAIWSLSSQPAQNVTFTAAHTMFTSQTFFSYSETVSSAFSILARNMVAICYTELHSSTTTLVVDHIIIPCWDRPLVKPVLQLLPNTNTPNSIYLRSEKIIFTYSESVITNCNITL